MGELDQAIETLQAGHRREAQQMLAIILEQNPNNELAWQWMSQAIDDPDKRRTCLQQILRINPANRSAELALAQLDMPLAADALAPGETTAEVPGAPMPPPASAIVPPEPVAPAPPPGPAHLPPEESARTARARYCTKCGAQVVGNFCSRCGHPTAERTAAVTPGPTPAATAPKSTPSVPPACPKPAAELIRAIKMGPQEARLAAFALAEEHDVRETAAAIFSFLTEPPPKRIEPEDPMMVDYCVAIELLTRWDQKQYLVEVGKKYKQIKSMGLMIVPPLIRAMLKASDHEQAFYLFSKGMNVFESLDEVFGGSALMTLVSSRLDILELGGTINHPQVPEVIFQALAGTRLAYQPSAESRITITGLMARGISSLIQKKWRNALTPRDWFSMPSITIPVHEVASYGIPPEEHVLRCFIDVLFYHTFWKALVLAAQTRPAETEKLYDGFKSSLGGWGVDPVETLVLAAALAYHGRLADTSRLVKLTSHKDWLARMLAYEGLIYQAAKSSGGDDPTAYKALEDPHLVVVGGIAWKMATIKVPAYRARILEGLESPEREKRAVFLRSVHYLAATGDALALEKLKEVTHRDADPDVRQVAQRAVDSL